MELCHDFNACMPTDVHIVFNWVDGAFSCVNDSGFVR